MANHDRQLRVLGAELVAVMQAAVEDLDQGRDPIVLLRHAGVEQYRSRRYRTPEVQQIESAMRSLERIQAKLGIPRETTVLGVFDRFVELQVEPERVRWARLRDHPRYLQEALEAALAQLPDPSA